MDKDIKKIMLAMVKTSYRHVFMKAICILLFKDIYEIQSTLKLNLKGLTMDEYQIAKDMAMASLLQRDNTVGHLRYCLIKISDKKDDLVSEVMKQYGLDKDSESDFYFEEFGKMFDQCIANCDELVMLGDYQSLTKALNMQ